MHDFDVRYFAVDGTVGDVGVDLEAAEHWGEWDWWVHSSDVAGEFRISADETMFLWFTWFESPELVEAGQSYSHPFEPGQPFWEAAIVGKVTAPPTSPLHGVSIQSSKIHTVEVTRPDPDAPLAEGLDATGAVVVRFRATADVPEGTELNGTIVMSTELQDYEAKPFRW